MTFVVSPEGDVQKFTTIEQARYWLRRKWPISDDARQRALGKLEAAMECMLPVDDARKAFLSAARTAGFVAQIQPRRPIAA